MPGTRTVQAEFSDDRQATCGVLAGICSRLMHQHGTCRHLSVCNRIGGACDCGVSRMPPGTVQNSCALCTVPCWQARSGRIGISRPVPPLCCWPLLETRLGLVQRVPGWAVRTAHEALRQDAPLHVQFLPERYLCASARQHAVLRLPCRQVPAPGAGQRTGARAGASEQKATYIHGYGSSPCSAMSCMPPWAARQ